MLYNRTKVYVSVLILLKLAAVANGGRASLLHICAKQGGAASSAWLNASRTCLAFHPQGAPIQAPQDSNNTKWGQIQMKSDNTVSFIDRNGLTYPINNPPKPSLAAMRTWKLLIFQASLRQGNVSSYSPVLYVPYSTVMATMANTVFEGELYNLGPRPSGVNETAWFKWSFGHNITVSNPSDKYGTLLHGYFVNRFHAAVDAHGSCQPALCADPSKPTAACQYYMKYFGNSSAMTLNWDTSMHNPSDTELVPIFTATQRQYMAAFSELYKMLQLSYSFVPRNYSFVTHGNPLGTPSSFTGTLVKAGKHAVQKC